MPLRSGNVATLLVLLDDDLARLAGECAVVQIFESVESVAVGADVAEDRRGQRSRGIPPRRLGKEPDARQRQRFHFQGNRVVHAPGDVDETPRLVAETAYQCVGRAAEDRREVCSLSPWVVDGMA